MDIRCKPGQMWLGIIVASGLLINMNYELLLSARWPGRGVVFASCVAQMLVGGLWMLVGGLWMLANRSSCRLGIWTRGMACALLLSSVGNGFALDYVALNVALNESGVQLYIILHSTATLFASIIAVLLLRRRVTLAPRPIGGGHQKPSEAV